MRKRKPNKTALIAIQGMALVTAIVQLITALLKPH
jgi:hypothetical protein